MKYPNSRLLLMVFAFIAFSCNTTKEAAKSKTAGVSKEKKDKKKRP